MRFDVITGKWLELKPKPGQATIGSNAVRVHDDIYITGGMNVTGDTILFDPTGLSAKTLKYMVATNLWAEEPKMPKGLAYTIQLPLTAISSSSLVTQLKKKAVQACTRMIPSLNCGSKRQIYFRKETVFAWK